MLQDLGDMQKACCIGHPLSYIMVLITGDRPTFPVAQFMESWEMKGD